MNTKQMRNLLGASVIMATAGFSAAADQFVLKLQGSMGAISPGLQDTLKVQEVERFEADGASFVILDAQNEAYLETFLNVTSLSPLAVMKVDFVNSPVVGGGVAAAEIAQDGLQTFVIERPIPGVGSFPLARKEGISRASNAAIAQMEGKVEWVHSYLTEVGTVCIYRATDEGQIADHAQLAGAPLGPITAVDRVLPD